MKGTKMVGVVTIGQSPRNDVLPEMKPFLGKGIEVRELGALDDLSRKEIQDIGANIKGDLLVTRLRDGTEVKVGHNDIIPRVEACIRRLENEVPVIILICTGTFPQFKSKSFILYPEPILYNVARSVLREGKLGVLTPGVEQIQFQRERWMKIFPEVSVMGASPYVKDGEAVKEGARKLKEEGANLIVMDCMGYTLKMKDWVKEVTGKPALLARTTLARVAGELLG
jgi:protein AroM